MSSSNKKSSRKVVPTMKSHKLHRPGIEPGPLAWKARILTTGPSVYK